MKKIGFVSNYGIGYEAPHHGENRYARRLYDVLTSMSDIQFIPPLSAGSWDILILQPYRISYSEPLVEIEKWATASAKQIWFIGWGRTYSDLVFDVGIMSHGRALRRLIVNGYIKNGVLWYPPLYPIDATKDDYVVYSPGFYDIENMHVLELANKIKNDFGLTLKVNRMDWYINKDYNVPLATHRLVGEICGSSIPNLQIYGEFSYTWFQEWIASAKVVIALHRGPSMVPMEAWVHGTPTITYCNQEEYLEPDYGFQVNRWKYGYDRLNAEIYAQIEKVMNGDNNQETIDRMRKLSNPEAQINKIKILLE